MNKEESEPVRVRRGHAARISHYDVFSPLFVQEGGLGLQFKRFSVVIHLSSAERAKENRAQVSQRSNNISK